MATARTSRTPASLLDDLLERAGQVLVEGARLHLDQPAEGLERGARLLVHGGHPRTGPRTGQAAVRPSAGRSRRNVTGIGTAGNWGGAAPAGPSA